MTESAYAIETRNLGKTYRGVQALRGLNLKVPRNSIFGFLGPNGAGKTTAIKLLLGLARPTAGTSTVFGRDIGADSVEIRRRVGYLAQDPRYYEFMTARETLRFTARCFYRGPSRAVEERVAEMLDLVGLAGKADRPIKGFSGGERQRLGLAQAQINRPELLILDEPAASLDPQGRHDVLSVMERLRERTTIFYSTHILEDVQRVSDTVAILNKGELIAQAPIGELLAGGEGAVYTVALRGRIDEAAARIKAVRWVRGLTARPENGGMRWEVAVAEDKAAEEGLLRLILADEGVTVTEFSRRQYKLEEIFLRLVGESERNGR